MIVAHLQKSTRSDKKWMVVIEMPNDKTRTIHFGAYGMSDYTIHKDYERMKRYEMRHKQREVWSKSGYLSAGFWSKWLLWNKPSLKDSIQDMAVRFGIKVKR